MITIKFPVALVCIFIWIGFILAISFMEAWLKFRAPGITVPLGLGIGRLVFHVLNKVEWVLALIAIISLIWGNFDFFKWKSVFIWVIMAILIMQTFWLIPALDARSELHIQGLEVPSSNLHFYYVGLELIKVTSLFIIGVLFFQKTVV